MRIQRTCRRTDIDHASALGAEVLHGFLRGQDQPQYVDVEVAMKMLLGYTFERRKLVDARFVRKHVKPAKRPFAMPAPIPFDAPVTTATLLPAYP